MLNTPKLSTIHNLMDQNCTAHVLTEKVFLYYLSLYMYMYVYNVQMYMYVKQPSKIQNSRKTFSIIYIHVHVMKLYILATWNVSLIFINLKQYNSKELL